MPAAAAVLACAHLIFASSPGGTSISLIHRREQMRAANGEACQGEQRAGSDKRSAGNQRAGSELWPAAAFLRAIGHGTVLDVGG